MTPAKVALGLLAAGACVAFVLRVYRRRELPVRGRWALGALRAFAVAIVVLLLTDPSIPVSGGAGGTAGAWLLVDGSASMATEGDSTAWRDALARLRAEGGRGGGALRFGGRTPEPVDPGSEPAGPAGFSLLTPAIERAAEGGARNVRIVSDLRIADAAEAGEAARRLGVGVEVVDVGRERPNVGVVDLRVPARVAEGEQIEVTVVLGVSGTAGRTAAPTDTVTVELRAEGRQIGSEVVPLPDPGRLRRVQLTLPPVDDTGSVRFTASVRAPWDEVATDDTRPAYTVIDPSEGVLALVSTASDWEPRFLLPVLAQISGLSPRGYLRAGADRWIAMGRSGAEATVRSEDVASTLAGAELLVVQAGTDPTPSWLIEALLDAPRVLAFASDADDAAVLGVATGSPLQGEWYADPDVPPSPVAAELAGVAFDRLPPLTAVLPLRQPVGSAPLTLSRAGVEGGRPALVLTVEDERRRAVALGTGFWRWAFRGEAGRRAYRRLWSGVTGWLLAGEAAAPGRVRPVRSVVEPGTVLEWRAPGGLDSLALEVSRGGVSVLDTVLSVPGSGLVTTGGFPPGSYDYRARAIGGPPEDDALSAGRFDVVTPAEEFLLPRVGEALLVGDGTDQPSEERDARPLRTHPLPYLLLIAALCLEWIGRRRRGLR